MATPANAGSARFSVIVEMENARTICWEEVGGMLRALVEQLAALATGGWKPQVLLVHPGTETDSPTLRAAALQQAPRLDEAARLQVIACPQGRYYELKNAGIARADGDIVVLLDSDSVPERDWLQTLLAPFEDPGVTIVSGHTYLSHCDFVSRVLALIWLFPLREGDQRAAQRRALNANNCAFRREALGPAPFPRDHGFKVSCTKLMRRLEAQGIQLVRVPAYATHAPLTGWRFLAWRALVTGRDADRKYAALKSPARGRRLVAALGFAWRMQMRAVRRVLFQHRLVQMAWYEVPPALLLGLLFYALAGLAQLKRACGLTLDRPETIPACAEHH